MQRAGGSGKTVALTAAGLRDLARAAIGRAPYLVPVVGPAGSAAVISAPGADDGYRHIMGPTFRNEMCGRGMLRIAANRPVRAAGRVRCPTLLVIAERDNIAPPASVHQVARRLGGRAQVLSPDCSHFDIYVGANFEASVAAQTEFVRRTLG